jgi:hypothetical protein
MLSWQTNQRKSHRHNCRGNTYTPIRALAKAPPAAWRLGGFGVWRLIIVGVVLFNRLVEYCDRPGRIYRRG